MKINGVKMYWSLKTAEHRPQSRRITSTNSAKHTQWLS